MALIIINNTENPTLEKYRVNNIPAVGLLAKKLPDSNQLSFD